ncbi:MAG: 3-dehydroquinate dehydratase [Firmicutes bacterium ADurb.Bin419]|nr:MAG: 3-dehydroquinate dehydratase [Firmicutes bacterium ADurb.Bin419]
MKILILNGPNLNMLGLREPAHYGCDTLAMIEQKCKDLATSLCIEVDFKQSNHEGELVTLIQQAYNNFDGIIINPAAYTHTSIAIMDALLAVKLPVIEVHLSNIHKREEFRHISYVSKVSDGIICGLGSYGYELAINAMKNIINRRNNGNPK